MSTLREFDLDFEGTSIHCWEGGTGMPLVLLHGSGAGAATMSNFKRVIHPLTDDFRVVAADLVGYGQSGRHTTKPYFDVDMWTRQVELLMQWCASDRIGLIGHSLSGALVLRASARNAAQVCGVVTTGTMGEQVNSLSGGPVWTYPKSRDRLRKQIERTVARPELIDDQELDVRERVLSAPGYQEYFEEMYSQGQQHHIDAAVLTTEELRNIRCPVVLLHGADDRSFTPDETSLPLAKKIHNSEVRIFGNCAHSVALEQPQKFMSAVRDTFLT
ncbi:alpha/beta fold hydrolase [Streptomyces sp. SDT5-1]|uniref:alpha/beta fold hydrolase n=1 Tax=Streptomyces sp. SDT5-1 TaxID=3406418 RepID=UPI003FD0AA43